MPFRMNEFSTRWLARFALPQKNWRKPAREHFFQLPFCDGKASFPLLDFLFRSVPEILEENNDPETKLIAEAYGWTCYSFWQCGSAFPSFPESYAEFLRAELLKPAKERNPGAAVIAGLLAEQEGHCGFNRLVLADPAVIKESETRIHGGQYEFYLKAQEKYEEFEFYLMNSAEFQADWDLIKACCAGPTGNEKILRRSLIPERNWVRDPSAPFSESPQQFQAAFDLFCWKYYLWGMEGDQPLLLKTSVVFTPYGTQLFIPGYMSFDPKRDFDFSKVTKLHRARGISRQGPGFSVGRKELAELRKKAKEADKEARRNGLKGEPRYQFVCEQTGFRDKDDFRRLRKLLD